MKQKEKLEEARRLYKDANEAQRYVLELLFPELAESEDEKIRKWLIGTIKQIPDDSIEWKTICKSDVLAWLDRPSEEKPEWSEEDEKKRSLLISILKVNHPNDYFKVNPANTSNMEAMSTKELVDWLKSLRLQNTCKPNEDTVEPKTEWIEEDEEMLKKFLHKVEVCDLLTNKENVWIAKKLKALKVQSQPAWSEEDEKRAERLLGWLDTLVNYIHHDAIVSLDLRRERMQQVERLKTWLEFLKDKVGNFDNGYKVGFSAAKHNQWKPSDVQMRILSIYADQNNTHGAVLTSLYQDLKKLKG